MITNHLTLISEFAAHLRYDDLPTRVVERIKCSILDTFGCGLYGSLTPWGRTLADYAEGTAGESVIWGKIATAEMATVAMANATMVHSFELDDLHMPSRSHPGGVTIPVAMAIISQRARVSGKELIAAVAAGYEVTIRVGMAQGVSSFNRGWHPTGTAGCFGAAATAAHILKLDSASTQHSLGIAGTMPCGLMAAQYGSMVKRLYAGHAASVGVLAGKLAQRGYTGIPDIFDAEFGGYLKAISDDIDPGLLSDGLGEDYCILELGYKFYSCVGASHTALDATRQILEAYPIAVEDIKSIRVVTSEYQRTHAGWPYVPSTVMAAQMSIQYCVAAMVMFRKVFVDQFTPSQLQDPVIIALAHRVSIESDPEQSSHDRKAWVEMTLNDGRQLSAYSEYAIGHPHNPASWSAISEKFIDLARNVLPQSRCSELVSAVDGLENCDDLTYLSDLLRLPG